MLSFDALNVKSFAHIPDDPRDWPEGSWKRSKFGQSVLWFERRDGGFHVSSDDLAPYRYIGDGPVDAILDSLEREGRPLGPGDDLIALAEKAKEICERQNSTPTLTDKLLASFLDNYSTIPNWVDVEQLRRGQEVFLAYLPVASLSLYYRSLVAGFSIPKIAKVIRSTAYLAPPSRPDQVLQRLLDTGELTTACIGLGVDALLPGGIGWKTTLYVRVLHAKVRHALLKRKGEKQWNTDEYGIPINQEDMAATLLAFSVNVLFGIDMMAGMSLTEEERLDYLALWRYIGFILGVETPCSDETRMADQPSLKDLPAIDPCGPGQGKIRDPIRNSNALLQSMIFHLLDPDSSSVDIAHHLLKITDRRPPSMQFREIPDSFYRNELFYLRSYNCRRMIGDPLADALELPYHPRWWIRLKICIKSQFIFCVFRLYTASAMAIPVIRRWMIHQHSRALQSFHDRWIESHATKMSRALAKNEKATVLLDEEDENNKKTHSLANKPETPSLCPFAMTSLPVE
jgi:ER-bound oxygenase mpaB/B'/Rubber oxygenase, catalytic domain